MQHDNAYPCHVCGRVPRTLMTAGDADLCLSCAAARISSLEADVERLRGLLSSHRLALRALIPVVEKGLICEILPALRECLAAILKDEAALDPAEAGEEG